MRSSTTRLLLNSLSGGVLFLVNVCITFVMSPIIVRELGNQGYGIWEMILSVVGYLGVLEVGVGPAIIRYVSRERALGNRLGIHRVLSSAFWGLLLVGVLAFTILAFMALSPESILGVSSDEVDGLPLVFLIVGCSLCSQFVGMVFTSYLLGCQEHTKINSVRLLIVPLQAVAIYFSLTRWDGFELSRLAGVGLLGNVIQFGIFAVIVLRREDVSLSRTAFSWEMMRELYRFGANSLILMVAGRIQGQSLPLVIGHTIGAGSVVFYTIPKRLVDYARNFLVTLGHPLMPYLSTIDAQREPSERMEQWLPLSRAMAFVSVPVGLVLLFLGKPFIAIWLGTAYAEAGQWVIVSLALSFLLTGSFANSGQVLVACAKHGRPAQWMLVVSVATVMCAIPGSREFGVTGAAVILALADLAGAWILWQAASQEIGIGLPEHMRIAIRPILLPMLIMGAALSAGTWLIPPAEYASLVGVATASLALYLASAWWLAFTGFERHRIQEKVSNLLGELRKH